MKAYVLGVKSRFRGENLVNQLRGLGFDVEVVYGIDAREAEPTYLQSKVDQKRAIAFYGHRLTAGEICCALGHQEIQRRIAEKGEDWALVMEDDVEILAAELNEVLTDLPQLKAKSVVTLRLTPVSDSTPSFQSGGIRFCTKLTQPPFGTFAYFMSLGAARIAVASESGKAILGPSDWPLRWKTKVSFFATNKPAVNLLDAASEIEHERSEAEKEFGWRKSGAKSLAWRFNALAMSFRASGVMFPAAKSFILSPLMLRLNRVLVKIAPVLFGRQNAKPNLVKGEMGSQE